MSNLETTTVSTGLKTGFVYALSDPRNPKVPRYIGKTTKRLRNRLGYHIARCSCEDVDTDLGIWINGVMDEGLLPVIYLLETCSIDTLQERETCWIRFFKPLGLLTNRSEGNGTLGMKLGRPSEKNIQATIARNKLPKSAETIEKMRESRRHQFRPVMCVETGQKFESIAAAERHIGCAKFGLRTSLVKGGTVYGKHYKFIEKEPA